MLNIKERAKWDAWKKLEGQSADKAEQDYTSLVENLKNNYGLSSD